MSAPLIDVWDGSQTSTNNRPYPNELVEVLEDRGLLAYGELNSDEQLTDRDNDRVRVLKFISEHPEGTSISHITSYVLKGVRPTRCSTDFASDSDYRFVNQFVNDLASHDPPLVESSDDRDSTGGFVISPTLGLLDLISYGVRETVENSDYLYDRDFCENVLRQTRGNTFGLSDTQKDILANSLRRYLQRIDDYRLAFDVTLDGPRNRSSTRRMTKHYKTRFNDAGRQKKSFARLQQSLDWTYDHGETAVFTTLTTWPKLHDSLYDSIKTINPAFHNLTQYLKSDPSTKGDTRDENTVQWSSEYDSEVTGRPREQLQYLKVLEFTAKGYPHLHALFADPPRRESDGMPWLIDKAELSKKWEDYGQGKIVDTYPLTYRDDLKPEGTEDDDNSITDLLAPDEEESPWDAIIRDCVGTTVEEFYRREHLRDARFNAPEGFVCWYSYGDHDHSDEWVKNQTRYHQDDGLIDMDGDDENPMQKTAGSYIGKYVSKQYGTLFSEYWKDSDYNYSHDGEAAPWKLAMYWATQKQFWSISQGIRDGIRLDDDLDDDVRAAVNNFTEDTLVRLSQDYHDDELGEDFSLPRLRRAAHQIVRETIADVDFLGAYPVWDLPTSTATAQPLTDLEKADRDPESEVTLASRGDRPPPIVDIWDQA